ncbi:uncharacterized protein PFL1_00244 [Pseudozyma flocculosa PF-1]|uniref:Uncharacterized protein n=1 Tax=Pseudozyma flocculosa TaxID=84751 RepID=A0A5C3EU03_9BASI|nr:uncharacterized protein PFL1_00244 [Pseudozyma flocculosa PF-1]EPQ32046.1 hypothetical protein PFL1_00244 [Pseudozyma flocculosa PF-1]SPO35026.1 uncharacterized protein PSFLO_00497 [Pseudozyma flocculosa]
MSQPLDDLELYSLDTVTMSQPLDDLDFPPDDPLDFPDSIVGGSDVEVKLESRQDRSSPLADPFEFLDVRCDRCLRDSITRCGVDRSKRPKGVICDSCFASSSSCRVRGQLVSKLSQRTKAPPLPPRPMPSRAAKSAADSGVLESLAREMTPFPLEEFRRSMAGPHSSDIDDDDDDDDDDAKDDLHRTIKAAKKVSVNADASKSDKRKAYGRALVDIEARCRKEAARFGIKIGRERKSKQP